MTTHTVTGVQSLLGTRQPIRRSLLVQGLPRLPSTCPSGPSIGAPCLAQTDDQLRKKWRRECSLPCRHTARHSRFKDEATAALRFVTVQPRMAILQHVGSHRAVPGPRDPQRISPQASKTEGSRSCSLAPHFLI